MIPDTRNHIRSEHTGECWCCGQQMNWVEINYEAWLCPGACTVTKDREFRKALKRTA